MAETEDRERGGGGRKLKLYKLTDKNYCTTNDTKWGEGVVHEVKKRVDTPSLCCDEVIHAYRNPNLGLLLNPIHASIPHPVLWEAEGDVITEDYGKVGCYQLTTVKKLSFPKWYEDENARKCVMVLFTILCAETVLKYYKDKYPKNDRPRKAIQAAREYLKNPSADAAARAADAAAAAAAYKLDFGKLADMAVQQIMEAEQP